MSLSLSISLIGSGDEISLSLSKESPTDMMACSSCDATMLKSRCCHKSSRSLSNILKIYYFELHLSFFYMFKNVIKRKNVAFVPLINVTLSIHTKYCSLYHIKVHKVYINQKSAGTHSLIN